MTAAHRLEDAEVKVSAFARAVALKRAAVAGGTGFALAFAVHQGWITPGLSTAATNGIGDGLELLTIIGAGAWIHRGTTPANSALQPRNSDGQDLVPDPSVGAAVTDDEEDPELAAAVMASPVGPTPGAGMDAAIAAAAAGADRPQPPAAQTVDATPIASTEASA